MACRHPRQQQELFATGLTKMCFEHQQRWKGYGHQAYFRFKFCSEFPAHCLGPNGTEKSRPLAAEHDGICGDCVARQHDPNPAAREEERQLRLREREQRVEREKVLEWHRDNRNDDRAARARGHLGRAHAAGGEEGARGHAEEDRRRAALGGARTVRQEGVCALQQNGMAKQQRLQLPPALFPGSQHPELGQRAHGAVDKPSPSVSTGTLEASSMMQQDSVEVGHFGAHPAQDQDRHTQDENVDGPSSKGNAEAPIHDQDAPRRDSDAQAQERSSPAPASLRPTSVPAQRPVSDLQDRGRADPRTEGTGNTAAAPSHGEDATRRDCEAQAQETSSPPPVSLSPTSVAAQRPLSDLDAGGPTDREPEQQHEAPTDGPASPGHAAEFRGSEQETEQQQHEAPKDGHASSGQAGGPTDRELEQQLEAPTNLPASSEHTGESGGQEESAAGQTTDGHASSDEAGESRREKESAAGQKREAAHDGSSGGDDETLMKKRRIPTTSSGDSEKLNDKES